MRGRVLGELKIQGTPSTPSILGSVSAEKDGKVYFNETEFQVVSGVFEFTDPKDLNPTLYLSATARVQEYDITLIVSGTAHNPKIVLSSQPALSQTDIVSLLALGSTNNNRLASLQQGSTASFSVGSAILKQNPIGRELKDRFGVDLQFTSSVDDTDSVALQKIAITGQISKKLSWDYNRVVGSQSADEAHLRYRLTNRFSVVGSYEDQEFSEIANTEQIDVQHDNVFGLDLEYRFEFK
jgi:translocation and assembly module TamB